MKRHTKRSTKHTRGKRRHKKRGGSVIRRAAVPFGLLALQKLFHTKKARRTTKGKTGRKRRK